MTNIKMNSEFSLKLYLMFFAIIAVSFIATWLLPVSEVFKGITAIPGTGALLAVLYQILRDQMSHERQKELQRRQHFFNLGVTSHMASVAFDKHVEFCEKYISQMDEGLRQLFIEGPNVNALSFARKLSDIRFQFRPWLTEDIMDRILPYEKALIEIGSKARLEEHLPVGEKRTRVIDEMFKTFSDVAGIRDEGSNIDEQITTEKIINHLQQVLGIQELTTLRRKVIAEAVKSISEEGT